MPERRLFVHVGLQKTGTSYLQSILWQSTEQLARQGLDMVPETKRATFNLMLDVRDRFNEQFDPPEVGRAVDELPERLAKARGDRALISEESLAAAKDEQIERLLAACRDREVHIIVTVRDLARAIPSSWQQSLQAGAAESFDDLLKNLRNSAADGAGRHWRNKDVPAIVGRWASHVPPERIHIVTVPPSGSEPELLLRRFCSVLEIDPGALNVQTAASNPALTHVGAELLRRVNAAMDPEYRRRDVYGDVGKRYFAIQVLRPEPGQRIRLPRHTEHWIRDVSARHIEFLSTSGCDIVGDLSDLEPAAAAFGDEDLNPTEEEVAAAATRALARVLSDNMEKVRVRRRRAANQPRPRAMARRILKAVRRG